VVTIPRSTTLAAGLAGHGPRVALIAPTDTGSGSQEITYAELAARVEVLRIRLGPTRRLVHLRVAPTVDVVVAYLACLAGRHPVLLVSPDPDGAAAALEATYPPDVVIGATAAPTDAGWFDERRPGTAYDVHPELAVLLSTSGSTGSPKLVRLSHTNLTSNAQAIATYLGLDATDRAPTMLPLHYCYGLSVLNSHLVCGAGLVLTDRSVLDPGFWRLCRDRGVTSLVGVPYTFDLLDRGGFAADPGRLPSLRRIMQAGGRLAPDRVVAYAGLGAANSWDFVVMYGQTEATARMAYLPPHLAVTNPQAVGVAIPGGRFEISTPSGDGVGELVFHGPGVMLGYAEQPSDLATGRTVEALATGDLARVNPSGLVEIVGRQSRFLKLLGLRIDLSAVERGLESAGFPACA